VKTQALFLVPLIKPPVDIVVDIILSYFLLLRSCKRASQLSALSSCGGSRDWLLVMFVTSALLFVVASFVVRHVSKFKGYLFQNRQKKIKMLQRLRRMVSRCFFPVMDCDDESLEHIITLHVEKKIAYEQVSV
jgi:hypothetical protein